MKQRAASCGIDQPMKTSLLLLALVGGLVGGSVVRGSPADEEIYLDRQVTRPDKPVPVSVVSPFVDKKHVGAVVELAFIVDENGRPRGIRSPSDVPYDLLSRVTYAISRWKFEPARTLAGEPKAAKVRLQVHIVDGERRVDVRFAKR